ncbi:primosomal protein N' [Leptolyngbya sp. FACHB-261]|uniref:primosomal protein N' n=1 Tax=Leptolyngbya sp. FACHB-261 TaxID=2692806 RepID=UPI00168A364C|nr:primosomal protein N' [Leptolyngbya sp. FACHB-261]MBD2104380.1 primosomal protein N' [Leptolyngbya sp. FACHB-261]
MSDPAQLALCLAESIEPKPPVPPVAWVEVLVDCAGVQDLYTYAVPPGLKVSTGDIVSVPFSSSQVGGIVVRCLSQLPTELTSTQIRLVVEVVSPSFFSAPFWILLERVAAYYCTPLVQAVRVALPPGLLARAQRRIRCQMGVMPPGAETFLSPAGRALISYLQQTVGQDCAWNHLRKAVPGAERGLRELLQRRWVDSYLAAPEPPRPKTRQAVTLVRASDAVMDLSPRQREVLEVLRRQGGDLWASELLQACHTTSAVLKALERKGYVSLQDREVLRSGLPGATPVSDSAKRLTFHQAQALEAIQGLQGSAQVLLHGITGSGKTEVYLQAIAPILQSGRSALVLVPEIGLTPQLTDRFRARFGDAVQVYHSALSDGERYDTWRQMLSGRTWVVIGTRSAVFAPLPNLGLIVLDEEHDASFKQDQPQPCYHAGLVARWRSELDQCPLVLGSATPALETWQQVVGDATEPLDVPTYLSLPHRVGQRPLPPVEVVDMRSEFRASNRSIFSQRLQAALWELQERRQQGILFIHRRGHSTFVSCRACGFVMECPNCDVSLAFHHPHLNAKPLLRCHYCGHSQGHPPECPQCESPYFRHFGSGTQRVVQELAQLFPDLRVIRYDSDTTRNKGAHAQLLGRFASGEADVLVGTQMLTKGIDLPQVTLVGVVSADGLLNFADFRAAERAFQTLTQVAGRAGRGEEPGRVILQTYTPEHPVIQAVQAHELLSFMRAELQERADQLYPPFSRLVLLRISGPDGGAVAESATLVAQTVRDAAFCDVLGPAPALVPRVARRYRWQVLLKLPRDTSEFPDLIALRNLCATGVSLTIDVDPLTIL